MQISYLEKPKEKTFYISNHTDEELNEKILNILSDKYCRQILDVTRSESKCASVLASETKIPISTVYRRLQSLIDAKLLDVSGMIHDDGKKLFLYKSNVKEIHAKMNGSDTEIVIVRSRAFNEEPKV